MPDPTRDELLRQVVAMRGEIRVLRWLSLLVGAVVFFVPGLGSTLVAWTLSFLGWTVPLAAPVVGTALAVIAAVVLASRHVPKHPESVDTDSGDTTI